MERDIMSTIHLNSANFDRTVSGGPTLVDFWASWCSPCKAVSPIIESLAEEYSGKVTVGKVNIEDETELADRFNIMSIPTVILFDNGRERERLTGARRMSDYKDAINKL